MKQDSKQVQVDLQDLGYETCGRSENEAEREESTSPGRSMRAGLTCPPTSGGMLACPTPDGLGLGVVLRTEGDTGPERTGESGRELLPQMRLSMSLNFYN